MAPEERFIGRELCCLCKPFLLNPVSTKKTETNHKANEKDAWEYKVSACEEHCY